jgi:hypothetical protein
MATKKAFDYFAFFGRLAGNRRKIASGVTVIPFGSQTATALNPL